MSVNNSSVFACPVCGKQLFKSEKTYLCKLGHCFDIASGGSVNLLLANHMNSHNPGDDKGMVNARSRFLSNGYYAPLREQLQALCVKYADNDTKMLDLGCGEGYYTGGVIKAIGSIYDKARIGGIDISKSAIKLACKNANNAELAVASVFHLPVANASIDLALNCFSPLCIDEIRRAVKKGGHFIYVVPGAKHLWELKSAIYESPYENEQKETPYDGFEYCEIVHIQDFIHLACTEDIENLFKMTPYYWKTSAADSSKLLAKKELDTKIEFDIHIYKKL